jgi:hypothetical protein
MSERAPYSRVYWSVMDDPKFDGIYEDDAAFALWMRLLMNADALWPAPAPLHRTAKPKALAKLVEAGIVDLLPRDRYRIHGLDAERGRRRDAARTGGKSDPNGTQTVPKREANGSPARALAEPSQAETRKAEPSNGRADAMDTYWTLLGTYPNGRTKEWLQELVNEFDDVRVSSALAVEANGPRQGVLSRVRDRLRSDADKTAKARATAETERLEAEAAARRITPEQAEENRRRVADELRKMGVKG